MTQNQKAEMYANITAHGNRLNAIFNTGLDPVALCKKLFRLENKAANLLKARYLCDLDRELELTKITAQVRKILFPDMPKDLRTYAKLPLLLSVNVGRDTNAPAQKIIDRGYLDLPKYANDQDCIIAPDFTPNR